MQINRDNRGRFATKWYNRYDFGGAFTLAIIINIIFWGAIFGGHDYYIKQVESIKQEGWEIGYFEGLNDGDANGRETATKEMFAGLSKNPRVSELFKKYFPEPEVAKTMRAISLSESKGKQVQHFKLNKNGSWDCGFFQTNTIHRNKGESMQAFCDRMNNDLEVNFKMARKIYDERVLMFGDGFTAWSDYNNGKYLKYLK